LWTPADIEAEIKDMMSWQWCEDSLVEHKPSNRVAVIVVVN